MSEKRLIKSENVDSLSKSLVVSWLIAVKKWSKCSVQIGTVFRGVDRWNKECLKCPQGTMVPAESTFFETGRSAIFLQSGIIPGIKYTDIQRKIKSGLALKR